MTEQHEKLLEQSLLTQVQDGRGAFKENYYQDSEGNHYVKIKANPYPHENQFYDDGTPVTKDEEVYFKVEPIVWRVLTDNYTVSKGNQDKKNALLLAETILAGGMQWDAKKNDYMKSAIRKWLNGTNGTLSENSATGDAGFFQTAFTQAAQELIALTTVDNSATSTTPDEMPCEWNEGVNQYASDVLTQDKIFLLSEQEVTKDEYGFDVYSKYGRGNTRIRVPTDYAKATGAYQSSVDGYGGWWWLRSPHCDYESNARDIDNVGNAINYYDVSSIRVGVVPALCIKLQ